MVSNINYFKNACMVYKHACLNTLLLLHSTFMLRVVKMRLKGEVRGVALNIPGNFIVDHEKSWNCVFEFLWEPCPADAEVHLKACDCYTALCLYSCSQVSSADYFANSLDPGQA